MSKLGSATAFVLAGLEVFAFVYFVLVQTERLPGASLALGMLLAAFSVAAEVTVLYAVSRRQESAAPVASRIGRWCAILYPVISAAVIVAPLAGLLPPLDARVFQLIQVPKLMAFAALGWSARSGAVRLERWACDGMLVMAALGAVNLAGPWWRGLGWIHAAVRAVTWAVLGAWLRTPAGQKS